MTIGNNFHSQRLNVFFFHVFLLSSFETFLGISEEKTHIKMFLRPEMSIFTFKNNHKLMYKRTKGLCEVIDKLSKRPKRPT